MVKSPIGANFRPEPTEPSPAMVRRSFTSHNNFTGGGLLLYLVIFLGIQVAATIVCTIKIVHQNPGITSPARMSEFQELITKESANGWFYIAAIAAGITVLVFYFRKRLPALDLFVTPNKMTGKKFAGLFFVFFGCQGAGQIIGIGIEKLLNLFGMSNDGTSEMLNDIIFNSFSMILYAAILGPIAEELVFRGFIMRRFQAWGKVFAIVMSAVLFGFFHMNLVQTPYCILVGIVFGYIAMEYGIHWSIIFHILNNGGLAFGFTLLGKAIGDEKAEYAELGFLGVCFVIGLIVLIVNRKNIAAYIRSNRTEKPRYFWAFTTPTILIVILLSAGMIAVNLLSTNMITTE